MKKITDYSVIDHGVENSQYFQGCGVAFTKFEDVSTGIGDTYDQALDNALDSLAQNDWDVEGIFDKEKNSSSKSVEDVIKAEFNTEPNEDTYWYVSVRVKGENNEKSKVLA